MFQVNQVIVHVLSGRKVLVTVVGDLPGYRGDVSGFTEINGYAKSVYLTSRELAEDWRAF